MKILIACEESQAVCIAFRAKGHEAYSCDIQECSGGHPEWHIQGDVFEHLNDGWDLMIFFWTCTRLCNSGVRWLAERNLWEDMEHSAKQFRRLLDANIPRIAGENPIPHKYARAIMGDYSQIIQPWQHGHGETKATCLWLKNLPPLRPTDIVTGREHRIHKMAPGAGRAKARSKTFPGIARAMAEQWGSRTERIQQ